MMMWTSGPFYIGLIGMMSLLHRSRTTTWRLLSALFVAAAVMGCVDEEVIEIIPVFPNDEPNLMDAAGVEKLTVTASPYDDTSDLVSKTVELLPGEKLNMKLAVGKWTIAVSGSVASREVVYGKTAPFRISRGKSSRVRFFVGRSMAFNEVELEPVEVANSLAGLVGLSAISFEDENDHPWILVTGGRDGDGGNPRTDAYIVDPTRFEIEKISSMSCSRAGHDSLVVDTEEGRFVVIAGGDDGSCLGDLDIFDPGSRTFSRVSACDLESTRGAVAELADSGGVKPVQNGWVIVPGNPRCKVNVLTGESVAGPTWEDPAPTAPLQAAINPSGRILISTLYELFVDTSEYVDTAGYDQCVSISDETWVQDAYWKRLDSGILGRVDATLHTLEDERFLYIGGVDPGEPEYGWRIVTTGECRLSTLVDGKLADGQPRSGFVLLDLGPHGGDDIALLTAGGSNETGAAMDKVYLFSQIQGATAPTLHDLSVESRQMVMRMRRPRSGHAAARTVTGDYWIFGGGASVSEIFVRGTLSMATSHRILEKRSPTLTSVSVLDTAAVGPEPDPLVELFKDAYVDILYTQSTEFRNMLFFVASADLGVGDGLLSQSPSGADECEDDKSLNIAGIASGNVSNIDLPEDYTFPIDNPGYNIENVKNRASLAIDDIASSGDNCGWRQIFAAGLGGLRWSVEVTDPTMDDPTLGVNILFFVTSEDDCSQGVYQGFDVEPADPPPGDVLTEEYCSSESYDDYFGLPPGVSAETGEAFGELLEELSWDPEDLVVVLLGNGSGNDTCVASELGDLELSAPRRLGATMGAMEDLRVEVVTIDLCEHDTAEELSEPMGEFLDTIRHRNPYQACLPRGVLDEEPVFDDVLDQYEPVEPDKALAQSVAEVCQLVYVEEEDFLVGTTQYRIAVAVEHENAVDPEITWVGTDSDGRAHCSVDETAWVVRVDTNRLEETSEGADVQALDLICLP